MDTSDKPPGRLEFVFYFGVICVWVGVLAAVVIPNFRRPVENINQHPCISNLRMIDSAKQSWGLENNKGPGDVPTWADILPYLGRERETKEALKCPQAGYSR